MCNFFLGSRNCLIRGDFPQTFTKHGGRGEKGSGKDRILHFKWLQLHNCVQPNVGQDSRRIGESFWTLIEGGQGDQTMENLFPTWCKLGI